MYKSCNGLQRVEIPYFYGVWKIARKTLPAGSVILTEYIDPGTTITDIRDAAASDETPRLRLRALKNSAMSAIRALKKHGVVHNDISGGNLVVSATEGKEVVVVVGFNVALFTTSENLQVFKD